jgi:hypothetical protein
LLEVRRALPSEDFDRSLKALAGIKTLPEIDCDDGVATFSIAQPLITTSQNRRANLPWNPFGRYKMAGSGFVRRNWLEGGREVSGEVSQVLPS